MARIISIDYGLKRTGLAVTDPLQIIATGLCTVETPRLMNYLKEYTGRETVEKIIIGNPRNLDDSETHITKDVELFMIRLKKTFPSIEIIGVDERYTSKMATRAMLEMGMKKKDRRKKALVDEIAATMMLQEYLEKY